MHTVYKRCIDNGMWRCSWINPIYRRSCNLTKFLAWKLSANILILTYIVPSHESLCFQPHWADLRCAVSNDIPPSIIAVNRLTPRYSTNFYANSRCWDTLADWIWQSRISHHKDIPELNILLEWFMHSSAHLFMTHLFMTSTVLHTWLVQFSSSDSAIQPATGPGDDKGRYIRGKNAICVTKHLISWCDP